MRDYILTSDDTNNRDEPEENVKNNNIIDAKNIDIKVVNNHIYFYTDVKNKSAQELNIALREVENELLMKNKIHDYHKEFIYLHINSFGGSVFAAFSIIDTIRSLKVPVVSIIEGGSASAATLISVVCDHRIIYETSYMLIHQLSSCTWGKMDKLEEEMINLKELMRQIKSIYVKYANIPDEELENILTHDLWWNANICLEKGLVDEVRVTERKYSFSKELLDI